MKIVIDIDENVFTRLFDNEVETSSEDREIINRTIRNGTPYEDRSADKWIPVSEELPDDREWYLAIFQETDTGWVNPLPFICEYLGKVTKFTTQDGWIIRDCTDVDIPHEYYTKLLRCVAWHPLPEPYKELNNE